MVTYSHFEQLKRYFIYEKVSNRNWLTHNKDLEKISAQIFQKKVTIYRMLHLVWPLLSRMCIIICCYNRASCAHGARRAHTLGPNGKNPPKTKLKHSWNYLREHSHMYTVKWFLDILDLPTYPNQMLDALLHKPIY